MKIYTLFLFAVALEVSLQYFGVAGQQCGSFADLKHSTVAERTVSLSFKIVNTCALSSVRMVSASILKLFPPHRTLCHMFVTPSGSCNPTPGCTCDDDGSYRVTRKLDDDGKPEAWYLYGELSNGDRFNVRYQVWAEELARTTLTTLPTTLTTLSPTSKASSTSASTTTRGQPSTTPQPNHVMNMSTNVPELVSFTGATAEDKMSLTLSGHTPTQGHEFVPTAAGTAGDDKMTLTLTEPTPTSFLTPSVHEFTPSTAQTTGEDKITLTDPTMTQGHGMTPATPGTALEEKMTLTYNTMTSGAGTTDEDKMTLTYPTLTQGRGFIPQAAGTTSHDNMTSTPPTPEDDVLKFFDSQEFKFIAMGSVSVTLVLIVFIVCILYCRARRKNTGLRRRFSMANVRVSFRRRSLPPRPKSGRPETTTSNIYQEIPDGNNPGANLQSTAASKTCKEFADEGNPKAIPKRSSPETIRQSTATIYQEIPEKGDQKATPQRVEPEAIPKRSNPKESLQIPKEGKPKAMPRRGNPEAIPKRVEPEAIPKRGKPEAIPDRDIPEVIPERGDPESPAQSSNKSCDVTSADDGGYVPPDPELVAALKARVSLPKRGSPKAIPERDDPEEPAQSFNNTCDVTSYDDGGYVPPDPQLVAAKACVSLPKRDNPEGGDPEVPTQSSNKSCDVTSDDDGGYMPMAPALVAAKAGPRVSLEDSYMNCPVYKP